MNQNLTSFSFLRMITPITIFPYLFQYMLPHQVFGLHNVKKVGINILRFEYFWPLPIRSWYDAKNHPPFANQKHLLIKKINSYFFRDIILLSL